MSLTVVTPPADEPVSLAEAKAQLNVTHTESDTEIGRLITAAVGDCELYHGWAYITRTLRLKLDAWPDDDEIQLPKPPCQSVTSVKYYDTAGDLQTLDSAAYQVDADSVPARIRPAYGYSWPSLRSQMAAVEVTYVAGYGDDEDGVPEWIKQAVLLMLSDLYENKTTQGIGTVGYTLNRLASHNLLCGDRIVVEE